MPIKRENLHFYDRADYHAVCKLVDDRAGGVCEKCLAPDRTNIMRVYGSRTPASPIRIMFWRIWRHQVIGNWHSGDGEVLQSSPPPLYDGAKQSSYFLIEVILTHAHLNQDPSDNRPANVALLCQWCHNSHDARARAANARETRQKAKDKERPLLAEELKAAEKHCERCLGRVLHSEALQQCRSCGSYFCEDCQGTYRETCDGCKPTVETETAG